MSCHVKYRLASHPCLVLCALVCAVITWQIPGLYEPLDDRRTDDCATGRSRHPRGRKSVQRITLKIGKPDIYDSI